MQFYIVTTVKDGHLSIYFSNSITYLTKFIQKEICFITERLHKYVSTIKEN